MVAEYVLHNITAKCNKESPITTMRSLIQKLRLKPSQISKEIVFRHITDIQELYGNLHIKYILCH